MGQALSFLAADLGAESGRVMVGRFDGDRLSLSEAHRFDSRPVRLPDGLHTDVLRIFSEIQHGLAAAAAQGGEVAGIGVDTWGVDFALLDADGLLLGNPYHYRDAIGGTVMESAFARVPRAEIFGATGVQLLEINTLFQLLRLQERGSAALARGAAPPDDAGPLLLLALRAGGQRVHDRHHVAVPRRGRRAVGHRACWSASPCPPRSSGRSCPRAPCSATCCPTSPRRRACRRGR